MVGDCAVGREAVAAQFPEDCKRGIFCSVEYYQPVKLMSSIEAYSSGFGGGSRQKTIEKVEIPICGNLIRNQDGTGWN